MLNTFEVEVRIKDSRKGKEKWTNFHTGFLANQKGNVIFLCGKHFMGEG